MSNKQALVQELEELQSKMFDIDPDSEQSIRQEYEDLLSEIESKNSAAQSEAKEAFDLAQREAFEAYNKIMAEAKNNLNNSQIATKADYDNRMASISQAKSTYVKQASDFLSQKMTELSNLKATQLEYSTKAQSLSAEIANIEAEEARIAAEEAAAKEAAEAAAREAAAKAATAAAVNRAVSNKPKIRF